LILKKNEDGTESVVLQLVEGVKVVPAHLHG
jgi:hypothetical protein